MVNIHYKLIHLPMIIQIKVLTKKHQSYLQVLQLQITFPKTEAK